MLRTIDMTIQTNEIDVVSRYFPDFVCFLLIFFTRVMSTATWGKNNNESVST